MKKILLVLSLFTSISVFAQELVCKFNDRKIKLNNVSENKLKGEIKFVNSTSSATVEYEGDSQRLILRMYDDGKLIATAASNIIPGNQAVLLIPTGNYGMDETLICTN